MKRIYDFCYCKGAYSPSVVWYLVRVGTTARDAAALRQLAQLACNSPHMLLAHHDASMSDLRQIIASAAFPGIPRPVCLMRTKEVDVQQLARFVKRCPLALLNSTKIDTPISVPALTLSGWKTSADIIMSRKRALPFR